MIVTAQDGDRVVGAATDDGRLVNRTWLCRPDGSSHPVDKQVLAPWERANTPSQPGLPPRAFQTEFGRLAVLICYDSEFPILSEALDPDTPLIPATTETQAGLTRVRTAARAPRFARHRTGPFRSTG